MVALLFNTLTLPASVGVALRCVSRGVASSVKSVWRAHTSHALRWPASETVIGVVSFPTTEAVASETSGERFSGARPGFPTSISATLPRFHSPRVPSRLTIRSSRPRIVASTACFALRLHAVATPPRGGLTPALALKSIIYALSGVRLQPSPAPTRDARSKLPACRNNLTCWLPPHVSQEKRRRLVQMQFGFHRQRRPSDTRSCL